MFLVRRRTLDFCRSQPRLSWTPRRKSQQTGTSANGKFRACFYNLRDSSVFAGASSGETGGCRACRHSFVRWDCPSRSLELHTCPGADAVQAGTHHHRGLCPRHERPRTGYAAPTWWRRNRRWGSTLSAQEIAVRLAGVRRLGHAGHFAVATPQLVPNAFASSVSSSIAARVFRSASMLSGNRGSWPRFSPLKCRRARLAIAASAASSISSRTLNWPPLGRFFTGCRRRRGAV